MHLEVPQFFQSRTVRQTDVSNSCLRQIEGFQSLKSCEVLQAGVRNARPSEIEDPWLDKSCKVRQLSIGHFALGSIPDGTQQNLSYLVKGPQQIIGTPIADPVWTTL